MRAGSLLDFLVFMSFFPKFAAGPLCRSRELMPQILGEQVFEHFLRNKRAEWQDYRLQVTPYELQRNLAIL